MEIGLDLLDIADHGYWLVDHLLPCLVGGLDPLLSSFDRLIVAITITIATTTTIPITIFVDVTFTSSMLGVTRGFAFCRILVFITFPLFILHLPWLDLDGNHVTIGGAR